MEQDGKNLQSSIHAMLDVGMELLGKGVHKQLYENHGLSIVVIWKSQATLVLDLHFTDNHYPESNGYECEIDDT